MYYWQFFKPFHSCGSQSWSRFICKCSYLPKSCMMPCNKVISPVSSDVLDNFVLELIMLPDIH